MTEESGVSIERYDAVALITLNRPQARNAVTLKGYDAIVSACESFATDRSLRVVVITGEGDAAFCAGTDISEFAAVETDRQALAVEAKSMRAVYAVASLPQVTVAAVGGVAAGGGLGLALACDLRVGVRGARLGVPIAATLGNALSPGFTELMVRELGTSMARRMLLTAELVPAEILDRTGFWAWMEDRETFGSRVFQYAQRLTELSATTQLVSKLVLQHVSDHDASDDVAVRVRDVVADVYGQEKFLKTAHNFAHGMREPHLEGELPLGYVQHIDDAR